MKFRSTRKSSPLIKFSEALVTGLAPDKGLYVPENFPKFKLRDLSASENMAALAEKVLMPFFEDDPLQMQLPDICRGAFSINAPVTQLSANVGMLELYHGPTAAFKDFGAAFLAQCLSRTEKKNITVMVATSGDTGGAVAAAFDKMPGVEVIVLFPKGKVSPFQEKQLTCWGSNVHAYAVGGTFDDCQRMAKESFIDPWWKQNKNLTSANSINIARILPQTIYYAWSSLRWFKKTGNKITFIVPSGNLGNSLAALWAKEMGLPVQQVVMACNANKAVPNYFVTGSWQPHPTVATLANAMDVGNPSNMERVLDLYPDVDDLREHCTAISVTDDQIKETIREAKKKWNAVLCPHTATAVFAHHRLGDKKDHLLVATAHAAKFAEIVEPLIGEKIVMPKRLEDIQRRPSHFELILPDLDALTQKQKN